MRLWRIALCILLARAATAGDVLRLEGEARTRDGGPGELRVLEREETFGGKVLSYWDDHGTWAEWKFETRAAGTYALSFRYAATFDTERRLEIDGRVPAGFPESVRFPRTGNYGLFDLHTLAAADAVPQVLELSAGKHVLRLTNVASTGLALDAILLHAPSVRFTDTPLPPGQARLYEVLMPAGPASPPVLSATRLAKGRVEAGFEAGSLRSLAVADTLFVVPRQTAPVAAVWFRTENLVVRRETGEGVFRLLITDGSAAYWVSASSPARSVPLGLTPAAYRREKRLVYPATWRLGDGRVFVPALGLASETSSAWSLGTTRITGVPALAPGPKGIALHFAEPARIAAVKVAPSTWQDSGMQLEVASQATVDTLRSAARRLPGIAAFYGYADFEIRFAWAGNRLADCSLLDLASGERQSLLGTGE